MRVAISRGVVTLRPELEDQLWAVACHAKEADHDIKLTGLHVQIRKACQPEHWAGLAWPKEETWRYNRIVVHPAGRIDLSIGTGVQASSIIRLFAHELRHIGQFHRGRKIYGYLTTEHMYEDEIEPDCYDFEEYVLQKCHKPNRYRFRAKSR